jgi:uncharacterized protein (TIGR03083 family)
VHHDRVTTPVGDVLRERCIEAVVDEGERFGDLARHLVADAPPGSDGLDVRVPWIPAWTARDLVGHLGTVHRWASAILRAGHTAPPPQEATATPPGDGLLDWYRAGFTELVSTLGTTPPDRPAWHMSPAAEKNARSWARRQAHELTVHRMDLEAAAGVPHAPVDPQLAEDGVDELLTVVVPRWAHTGPLITADAAVSVTATDTGRAWTVRVHQGQVAVSAERDDTADACLTGDTTQLLLRLWGRPADVTVDGDAAAEALLRGR